MKKIKNSVMLIFIVSITLCFVFLPRVISERKMITDSVMSWGYIGAKDLKITNSQVAQMYINREFEDGGIIHSYIDTESENLPSSQIKLAEILNNVFGNDSVTFQRFNSAEQIPFCYTRNLLAVIDNHPVALKISDASVTNGDASLRLFYEEKTQTLFGISFESLYVDEDDLKYEVLLAADMISYVEQYFETQLKLDSECWTSDIETGYSGKTVNGQKKWECYATITLNVSYGYSEYPVNEKMYRSDT